VTKTLFGIFNFGLKPLSGDSLPSFVSVQVVLRRLKHDHEGETGEQLRE
jgi:hypothetical protein